VVTEELQIGPFNLDGDPNAMCKYNDNKCLLQPPAQFLKLSEKASGHTGNKDGGLHGGRHLYRHLTIKAPGPSQ